MAMNWLRLFGEMMMVVMMMVVMTERVFYPSSGIWVVVTPSQSSLDSE